MTDRPKDTDEGRPIETRAEDGWRLAMTAFDPPREPDDGVGHGAEEGALILVLPAYGAPARPYRHMAAHLARAGHAVVTADPRGSGASGPLPRPGVDFGVDDIVKRDLPAIVERARAEFPGRPLAAVGHSIGGHYALFHEAFAPGSLRAVVLLTTAYLHVANYPAFARVLYTGFGLIGRVLGYVPGQHLGWGAPLPRQLTIDWAGWGLTGRYRGTDGADWMGPLARVSVPVLSVSFTDDTRLAPRKPVDALRAIVPAAHWERWHLEPVELEVDQCGHMEHLRGTPALWDRLDGWIRARLAEP